MLWDKKGQDEVTRIEPKPKRSALKREKDEAAHLLQARRRAAKKAAKRAFGVANALPPATVVEHSEVLRGAIGVLRAKMAAYRRLDADGISREDVQAAIATYRRQNPAVTVDAAVGGDEPGAPEEQEEEVPSLLSLLFGAIIEAVIGKRKRSADDDEEAQRANKRRVGTSAEDAPPTVLAKIPTAVRMPALKPALRPAPELRPIAGTQRVKRTLRFAPEIAKYQTFKAGAPPTEIHMRRVALTAQAVAASVSTPVVSRTCLSLTTAFRSRGSTTTCSTISATASPITSTSSTRPRRRRRPSARAPRSTRAFEALDKGDAAQIPDAASPFVRSGATSIFHLVLSIGGTPARPFTFSPTVLVLYSAHTVLLVRHLAVPAMLIPYLALALTHISFTCTS